MLTTDLPATAYSTLQNDFFSRSLPPPTNFTPAFPPKTPVSPALPSKSAKLPPKQTAKTAKPTAPATKGAAFWPTVASTNLVPVDELLVRRVLEEAEDVEEPARDHGPSLEALLQTSTDEPPSTFIAKRLMQLLKDDLSGQSSGEPDLFGHIEHDRENRKLDALIWIYGLNPDGAEINFNWVCDELGNDPEVIRRVVAKNMRQELKRVLKILCGMVSLEHAKNCEIALSEYVCLTGWNLS